MMTTEQIKRHQENGIPVWILSEQFVISEDTDYENDEVWIHDPNDTNRFDKPLTLYQAETLLSTCPQMALDCWKTYPLLRPLVNEKFLVKLGDDRVYSANWKDGAWVSEFDFEWKYVVAFTGMV